MDNNNKWKKQHRVVVEGKRTRVLDDYTCREEITFFSKEWAWIIPLFGRGNIGKYKVIFTYRSDFPNNVIITEFQDKYVSIGEKINDKTNGKVIFYVEKTQ